MTTSVNERAIYPLIAIFSSLLILADSLILAKKNGWIFLAAVVIVLAAFGMGKYVLKVVPAAVVLAGLYFLICWLISRSAAASAAGAIRIAGVCLAVVPGFSVPPVNLTRALNDLKAPRSVSIGILITLRFFPLLSEEIRNIRDAMKTRGAGHSAKTLYRSTILPFCVRLVNISDLLALSVETRGFSREGEHTVWKSVRVKPVDIAYLIVIIAVFAAALVVLPRTVA